jgi:hypothetical protein
MGDIEHEEKKKFLEEAHSKIKFPYSYPTASRFGVVNTLHDKWCQMCCSREDDDIGCFPWTHNTNECPIDWCVMCLRNKERKIKNDKRFSAKFKWECVGCSEHSTYIPIENACTLCMKNNIECQRYRYHGENECDTWCSHCGRKHLKSKCPDLFVCFHCSLANGIVFLYTFVSKCINLI